MNATEPYDAGTHDPSHPGVRRWQASRGRLTMLAGMGAFFLLVGTILTVGAVSSGQVTSMAFMALWWGAIVVAFGRRLRWATRVELHADGSLVLSGPVRVVHTHVACLRALRAARSWGRDGGDPGVDLETTDTTLRLPRSLVTEDLVAALRVGNPDISLPYFRGW